MATTLALFDFDGTITKRDSFLSFLKFHSGSFHYYVSLCLLSPFLVLMKLGLYSAKKAKERFLTYHLKGLPLIEFEASCSSFYTEVLIDLIRPGALRRIREHQNSGDLLYIVSASPRHWILPFAKQVNAQVLSTELEVANSRLTGKIDGENCKGVEKVRRLNEELDLSEFTIIYAYGDSTADLEMLELADFPSYKPFR